MNIESQNHRKYFWKKKEDEIGEKIKGKILAEFQSDKTGLSGPILGLLFYTKNAMYFQTFPRKNWLSSLFRPEESCNREKILNLTINWQEIRNINFLKTGNFLINMFLPNNFRILIDCQCNKNSEKLVFTLHCRKDGDELINFFVKYKNKA